MTHRKKNPQRRKPNRKGFGFSGFGIRALMNLFTSSINVQPHERRDLQNIFGQAVAGGLILGCTVMAVAWFGWIGLIIGPVVGMYLAGSWLESDSFFD